MDSFAGVDLERVKAELQRFVDETEPRNMSGGGVLTTRSGPACGRARAIELRERVRPILDALYPRWMTESGSRDGFEFRPERDSAMKLLARIDSHDEIQEMLGNPARSPQLAAGEMHHLVWQAASAQWTLGQVHEAVLASAKAVNSMLQSKVGRRDLSEVKLTQEAFSERPPQAGKPRLRFTHIADKQTSESTRQGVMAFGVGCFQAIRNPLGHLPNDELELSEQEGLERLASLSLFARWIEEAEVEGVE